MNIFLAKDDRKITRPSSCLKFLAAVAESNLSATTIKVLKKNLQGTYNYASYTFLFLLTQLDYSCMCERSMRPLFPCRGAVIIWSGVKLHSQSK